MFVSNFSPCCPSVFSSVLIPAGRSGSLLPPRISDLVLNVLQEDLTATDTVLIDLVEGGQYWKNSGAATFLRNCGGKWTVIEAPKATALANARDTACSATMAATATAVSECTAATRAAESATTAGFFGELMTFNSGNA